MREIDQKCLEISEICEDKMQTFLISWIWAKIFIWMISVKLIWSSANQVFEITEIELTRKNLRDDIITVKFECNAMKAW